MKNFTNLNFLASRKEDFYLCRVKFIGVTLEICMNSHVLRWHQDSEAEAIPDGEEFRLRINFRRFRKFSSCELKFAARISTYISHVISVSMWAWLLLRNVIVDWCCAKYIRSSTKVCAAGTTLETLFGSVIDINQNWLWSLSKILANITITWI